VARIAGVDLPLNKQIVVALTYIYGIGRSSSIAILTKLGIPFTKKVKELTEREAELIKKEIEENYKVEGALRLEVVSNIKRLIKINCYRGIRHKVGLPVRGQRTRTNARTRKGPRKQAIPIKKKGRLGKKG
jgi:small subunit ribosomal protein S13